MNILAIGNSFSEDATRYLKKIAEADNENLTVANLFIGGCPLSLHFQNIQEDKRAYGFQFNGEDTGILVSIKEAILSRKWDYIAVQQVSNESVNYATYQPYLNDVVAFVREFAPDAKIVVHQTWAYEEGSERLCQELKYKTQSEMFQDLKSAYDSAYNEIGADMLIPSGELFQKMIKKGIKVHRDTFHASLGLGRYALGILWYKMLTGNTVSGNTFSEFDEPASEDDIKTVKEIVDGIRG